MPVIAGKTTPTPNRREIRFHPGRGDESIFEIEGPKASMLPLITELRALGYEGTYTEDRSPIAKIQYQVPQLSGGPGGDDPPAEDPIPIWELFANAHEIDLLESDNSINVSDADKRIIREAISNPVPGQSPAISGDALKVYQLMLKGVKSARVNVLTLRQTRIVSGSFAIFNAILDNGRIFSSDSLRSINGVPTQIALPNYVSSDADFIYGWFKKFPQVQQTGFNKFNLNQEWEFGKWSVFMYGALL